MPFAQRTTAVFALFLTLQPVLATPPSGEAATGRLTLRIDPDASDRLQPDLESITVEDTPLGHSSRVPSVLRFNVVSYPTNAHSGWHYHPGISLVTVLDGVIEWYDANCVSHVHGVGDQFVERDRAVHMVRNDASTPARIIVTFIIAKGLPPRVSVPAPPCAAALGLH
ncbi:MAG TPA: cupin domain-containing protein [Steroidobacteraceae bacterium]|jgi:quercetin dioxygenase-like cupin family protein|nr:cupin domain-containing protein [Steroidobacteraceae bacterium]